MIAIPFLSMLSADAAYYSVGVLMVFMGLAVGITQGTAFALAAKFPGPEMGMVMFGNGIIGLTCNALRAISLAAWPESVDEKNLFKGALFNFFIGALIEFACAFVAM